MLFASMHLPLTRYPTNQLEQENVDIVPKPQLQSADITWCTLMLIGTKQICDINLMSIKYRCCCSSSNHCILVLVLVLTLILQAGDAAGCCRGDAARMCMQMITGDQSVMDGLADFPVDTSGTSVSGCVPESATKI